MTKVQVSSSYPVVWDKPPFIKRAWLRWLIILGAVFYLIAAIGTMDIDLQRVIEGLPRAQRFFGSFFPPNFADNQGVVWEGILESLLLSFLGTSHFIIFWGVFYYYFKSLGGIRLLLRF